jgi:hypothetical protein
LHEAQRTRQSAPDLMIWFLWVGLTVVGGVVGKSLILFILEMHSGTGIGLLFYLASPLFFVSLGQRLLLRRFVARAGFWLLTGMLGIFFMFPYFFFYAFTAEFSNWRSLMFGTPEFWYATGVLLILMLIFGSLVGWFQGMVVIKRYGVKRKQVLWWVSANAIAWAAGHVLGSQVVESLFWLLHPWNRSASLSWFETGVVEGTIWLVAHFLTVVHL